MEATLIRGLMSDEEWASFEPFVTINGAHNGGRSRDHRLVLDGNFWLGRTGAQWHDLPDFFGKWSSVYRQFRRWRFSRLWDLLLEALNDTEGVGETVQMIDSTIIRAHHCAAGARGGRGGLRARVLDAQKVASRLKFISVRTEMACP